MGDPGGGGREATGAWSGRGLGSGEEGDRVWELRELGDEDRGKVGRDLG